MEFTKDSLSVNKIRPTLIEPSFITGVAEVLTFGANKYSKDNWKLCKDIDLYWDALYRHLLSYRSGELNDAETGMSHLYHAACNIMFIAYLEGDNNEQELDDTI